MKDTLFRLLQWTWGFPQTLAGLFVFLLNLKAPHYPFHGSIVTVWGKKSSVSLGMFIFVTDDPFFFHRGKRRSFSEKEFGDMLTVHEYGHAVQSLIFGPLYLFTVGLPSVLWGMLPVFVDKRRKKHISYYSVYPEHWANRLGEKVTGEKSIGEPL